MYIIINKYNLYTTFDTIEDAIDGAKKNTYQPDFCVAKVERCFNVTKITAPVYDYVEVTSEEFKAQSAKEYPIPFENTIA